MHYQCGNFLRLLVLLFCVPSALHGLQLSENFGNKYANLVILRDLLKADPTVKVPEFFGISSERIYSFITNNCLSETGQFSEYNPLDLYASVIEKLTTQGIAGLQDFSIAQDLAEVARRIRYIFDNAWDGAHPFTFTADEKKFLDRVHKDNHYLMVRSTGIEDNTTFANAGANISKAYIVAEPEQAVALQKALGEVVASYVSVHSLKNRLIHEKKLDTNIFMPVLVQELVGEQIGGNKAFDEIPISGVAYTTNKQLSDNKLKVTEINASYGHGEGIVANKVLTDTYYMVPAIAPNQKQLIIPQVYRKEERLIPVQEGTTISLALTKNPTDFICRPSLTHNQLYKLYRALMKIEKSYGMPMDVEFVIAQETIFIVQARPAMAHQSEASYIDTQAISADKSTIQSLEQLVPSNHSVITITQPEQILLAATLDDADQNPLSAHAKVVIVHKWASSLSHAAVNFMAHGIPCFYSPEVRNTSTLCEQISEKKPLYIDTQQSLLIKAQPELMHNAIRTGWYTHPIKGRVSIAPYPTQLPKQIIPHNKHSRIYLDSLRSVNNDQDRLRILDQLEKHVLVMLDLSQRRIKNIWNNRFDSTMQEALCSFKELFLSITNQARAVIASPDYSEFQLLFYIKIIETLLTQKPQQTELFLGGLQYVSFLDALYYQHMVVQAAQKLGRMPFLSEQLLYAQHAPSPEIAQQWRAFMLNLDHQYHFLITSEPQSAAAIRLKHLVYEFKQTLSLYDALECLPLWFKTEFQPIINDPETKKHPGSMATLIERLLRKSVGSTPSC